MYVVLSALALDRLETCPSEALKEGPIGLCWRSSSISFICCLLLWKSVKIDITEFTTNFQVLLLGFYFGIKSFDSPLASLTDWKCP